MLKIAQQGIVRTHTSPDQLTRLYRSFGPLIYSRCWRALKEDAAAERATREVFASVQHALDVAEPRAAVEAIARACERVLASRC